MNRFTIKQEKAALVIIDMQQVLCRLDDSPRKMMLDRIVSCINRLSVACRVAKIPVIWVRHNIRSDDHGWDGGLYSLFHEKQRIQDFLNFGKGTEIFQEMIFDNTRDHVVFKNRYSAFLSNPPELHQKLQELNREQIIIAGVAANVCVDSTLRDAMQLDYEVILVSDGTFGTDEELYLNTLRNTQLFFGDVRNADEIIRLITINQL